MEASLLTVLWEFVGDYWPHLTIASSPAIYSLLRAVVMAYARRPKSTAGDVSPYFTDKKLLAPPLARPAYSDRMAYVLAEMSDLAYRPFEGRQGVIDDAVDKARSLNVTRDADVRAFLDQFSTQLLSGRYLSRNSLKNILGNTGFALLDVIDVDETQGFVCRRDVGGEPPYLVLAFRGTEMKVSDWLTDARCVPRVEGKAKVHTGFIEALTVRKDGEGRTVKEVVEEILGRPESHGSEWAAAPALHHRPLARRCACVARHQAHGAERERRLLYVRCASSGELRVLPPSSKHRCTGSSTPPTSFHECRPGQSPEC